MRLGALQYAIDQPLRRQWRGLQIGCELRMTSRLGERELEQASARDRRVAQEAQARGHARGRALSRGHVEVEIERIESIDRRCVTNRLADQRRLVAEVPEERELADARRRGDRLRRGRVDATLHGEREKELEDL